MVMESSKASSASSVSSLSIVQRFPTLVSNVVSFLQPVEMEISMAVKSAMMEHKTLRLQMHFAVQTVPLVAVEMVWSTVLKCVMMETGSVMMVVTDTAEL